MADSPKSPGYRLELARSYGALGYYLKASDRRAEAEAWLARACARCAALAEAFPDDPAVRAEYATNLRNAGDLFRITGRPREAERALGQAVDLRRRLVAEYPAVAEYQDDLAAAYRPLAELLYEARDLPAAERWLREGVAVLQARVTQWPDACEPQDFLAGTSILQGLVLWESGRPAEAEQALERAIRLRSQLRRDFPARNVEHALVTAHASYGALLSSYGRFADAERALRQALDLGQKARDRQPSRAQLAQEGALVYAQLADVYLAAPPPRRDARQARLLIEKALELKPNDAAHRTTRGAAYCRLGRWDEAAAAFRAAEAADGATAGSLTGWSSDNTALTRIARLHAEAGVVLRQFYLGLCHHWGDLVRGRACYRQALACWEARRQELAPRARELEALRAEAAAALGVTDPPGPSSRPAGPTR